MSNPAIKNHPLIVSSSASLPRPEATRRLLVLVSGGDVDLTVIRKVWDLAETMKANTRFLGVYHDVLQESDLRRRVVTMSAMLNYDNVCAEAEIIPGKNWVKEVKSFCQPGDLVVCFNEQCAESLHMPLIRILQADLDVPLYILSGATPEEGSSPNWLITAAAWTGFTAIVLGFLFIQVEIYHHVTNWTTTLELLSTAVEFWLISLWNDFVK